MSARSPAGTLAVHQCLEAQDPGAGTVEGVGFNARGFDHLLVRANVGTTGAATTVDVAVFVCETVDGTYVALTDDAGDPVVMPTFAAATAKAEAVGQIRVSRIPEDKPFVTVKATTTGGNGAPHAVDIIGCGAENSSRALGYENLAFSV